MKCRCEDWVENMPKVNAPARFVNARNPGSGDYTGKVFVFCPWCSESLIEDADLSQIPRIHTTEGIVTRLTEDRKVVLGISDDGYAVIAQTGNLIKREIGLSPEALWALLIMITGLPDEMKRAAMERFEDSHIPRETAAIATVDCASTREAATTD